MTPDAKRSLAKEDGRTVFAMLDDQSLRTHGQNFVRGPGQIGFACEHLRFGVVDQQDVHELQRFRQLLERALDPVIHGVAAGQAYTIHLAANVGLQRRLDIREEKEFGVFVLCRECAAETSRRRSGR